MGYLNYRDMHSSGEDLVVSLISKKNNPLIFDVGAADNSEFLKKIFARYPLADVYEFEPNPSAYRDLARRIKNSQVHMYQLGLGEKKGKVKLYDYDHRTATQHASIYKDNIIESHKVKTKFHVINIQTLDNFIKEKNLRRDIDFLKIDTEGSELSVLKGAINLLRKRKIRYIQFEFNEMNVYSRVFMRDFIELLPNYDLYRMMPNYLVPIKPYTPWLSEIFSYSNILCVLKDKNN
jgi:FkbM family methyltransferase